MRKHDTGAHPNDQYAGSGQDDGPVRFTFGKYKGRLIGDTPTDYLTWVWREALSIDPRIREAIRVELTARLQRDRQDGSHQSAASGSQPQSRTVACNNCTTLLSKWSAIYSRLARAAHPDRGGSHEAMQLVNEANELIRKATGGVA